SGSDLESCAIPHGGHACGPTATLPPAPGADARPHLLRRASDGALFVVDGRFADAFPDDGKKVFAWSSPACGTALVRPTCFAAWPGPVEIGGGMYDLDDARLTRDGAAVDLAYVHNGTDAFYQRAPLAGPPEQRVLALSTGERP